jgi:hypothetical protein
MSTPMRRVRSRCCPTSFLRKTPPTASMLKQTRRLGCLGA